MKFEKGSEAKEIVQTVLVCLGISLLMVGVFALANRKHRNQYEEAQDNYESAVKDLNLTEDLLNQIREYDPPHYQKALESTKYWNPNAEWIRLEDH
ncbi:hypothetical protein D3C87_280270 [compost metagenome]